jgi:hypothetical protein
MANTNTAQCATYYNHMITATAFNISSDLMIISIPIPLLTTAQLPLKRKLVLCAIFSLGIFVVSVYPGLIAINED